MSLIPLLLTAPLMLARYLKNDYAGAYSAYKFSGIFGEITNIFSDIGIVITILFVLGYIVSIINKKTRKFSIFMLLNMLITIIIFNTIQTMGPQHKYLIYPSILYGIFILISIIYNSEFIQKRKYLRYISIAIYVLLLITNFVFANINMDTFKIFSSPVLVLNNTADMSLIGEVVEYIDSITIEQNKKVYVLASSIEYNNETFSHYYLPDLVSGTNYSEVSHVDLVHGFNPSFYESDYIMTITPLQYHLNIKDQQVIKILYDAIENGSPLSDNYELIYEKDEELIFKIYEKIKEFEQEDKQYLADEFNKFYPEQKEMFEEKIL